MHAVLTAVNTDSEFEFLPGPVPNSELLDRLQQVKRHVCYFHRMLMAVSDW